VQNASSFRDWKQNLNQLHAKLHEKTKTIVRTARVRKPEKSAFEHIEEKRIEWTKHFQFILYLESLVSKRGIVGSFDQHRLPLYMKYGNKIDALLQTE
jgi:hypothetical protein